MLLWLVFALMSAAVVAALLHPLMRQQAATAGASDGSGAVYRDQLAEIDAEAERGLIGPDEAQSARREIARRLLARAPAVPATTHSSGGPAGRGSRLMAVFVAGLVPVLAIGFYLRSGSPGIPSQPVAARRAMPTVNAEMAKLIAAVEARLKEAPGDGRGWDVIAPVYLRLGRHGDAVHAYREAIRLVGEEPRRLAGLAEALMLSEEGQVSKEARGVLERLLALDPGHVQARFWLAFGKEQDGQLAEAADAYAKLLAAAPSDAPWRPMLEDRLQAVKAALGQGRDATGAKPPEAGAGAPGADELAAAERMSPTERQAMIDGMVTGLAARLAQNGRDLAGWQRLIRALTVLGRKDEALAALDRARISLADEPQAQAALADLAKSLGLGT